MNIAQEVQNIVDGMAEEMTPVQKSLYSRITSLLKDLSLDEEGFIKQTTANFKILSDVQFELREVIRNKTFQKNVASIQSALDDVVEMQNHFYDTNATNFVEPKVVSAYQNEAFNSAVDSLTGAGMAENVVNEASDIVSTGVKEGQSFFEMNEALKTSLLGDAEVDGKLVSYSKQILSDTLHGMARSYNSLVSDKLNYEWSEYIGPLKDTSREICIAAEKKRWFHKSELADLARGKIDGVQYSRAGMMPDTTAENIMSRCGGYNCEHHLMPIPSEMVPTKIRRLDIVNTIAWVIVPRPIIFPAE